MVAVYFLVGLIGLFLLCKAIPGIPVSIASLIYGGENEEPEVQFHLVEVRSTDHDSKRPF